MKIAIMTDDPKDISNLITSCTWSGDKEQVARKLECTIVQDDRDENIPLIEINNGNLIYGGDDEGNVVFLGKIFDLEKDRAKSEVRITAYDNLFILNKSKTTKKFSNALPEDIAVEICGEMGISTGNIATTGEQVSFIANNKTGYQIIMGAYTEAHKKNGAQYQCIMRGDLLDVIEKGELCGVVFDSSANMTDSIYKESIENLVNRVMVVDDAGNTESVSGDDSGFGDFSGIIGNVANTALKNLLGSGGGNFIDDTETQNQYGVIIQAVYKQKKDDDGESEAKDLFKKPEREGNITAIGDYRAITGYSVVVSDSLFKGQFWIKSDVHTFKEGFHEMKLTLEFENLMDEVEVEHEKPQNSTKTTTKSGRKRKSDDSTS